MGVVAVTMYTVTRLRSGLKFVFEHTILHLYVLCYSIQNC